jgi:O-Antigen ligase
MAGRAAAGLFLAALALLPWAALLPFPWLHPRAQWSDAVFAAAALAWAVDRARTRSWPKVGFAEAGMGLYLGMAALSLWHADPRPPAGGAKLLGMVMLAAWAVVTADLVPRLGLPVVARTVAVTALLTAVGALAGVGLFFLGVRTPFVGSYGDLVPGAYARAQAGLPHPNLLASFCIFAYGVVARDDAGIPPRLRRFVMVALVLSSLLTFSRGILALGLAALVRHAHTLPRRRLAGVVALSLVLVFAVLSWWNVQIDPTRPFQARILEAPSPRRQALVSSLATLQEHPWLGTGPGRSPGKRDGAPFDAHSTALNVAATLGLPALAGLALVPWGRWRDRPRPTDRATWGMLAGFALESLGHDVEDFRHVWVALGLAAAPRATLPPR